MRILLLVVLASLLLAPGIVVAQSGAVTTSAVVDSAAAAAAAPAEKKKKGMFGKVKGLAKNKIVKTVAKAALCTAVPGGQVIAGALDAAETKDVAGAATTVATGGGSCMPGMAGMAPSGAPGAAGMGAAGVGALGTGAPGEVMPGQPSAGMAGTPMSPEQMKQMQEQYGRMGMDSAQIRAMQQMMSSMPGAPSAAAAADQPSTEPASGAPALSREKGKLLVRQLPWVAGSDAIRPGGELMFAMAMHEVALAMLDSGKRYKVEARVEQQGGKTQNRELAQKRAAAVVKALVGEGVSAGHMSISDGSADKNPRIVISERK